MQRFVKHAAKKKGLAPGTVVYVGRKRAEQVDISVIEYDETRVAETEAVIPGECAPSKDSRMVTWINVNGLHETDVIKKIGRHFDIHPLVLEDIVHTVQRPKVEDHDQYLFIVLNMLSLDETETDIRAEQISLLLGSRFLISFQEEKSDLFEPVREGIRGGNGRLRKMGADYLAYMLLDAVVDSYYVLLERIGEKIDVLEEELVANPDRATLQTIHTLKREMIALRRSVWPLREVINRLQRGESPLIHESTAIYLRDIYDHTVQIIDTIDTYRDIVSGMLDIYLSSLSNRMNEVMKVLTVISTIFMPLTFIAGVYGMNFRFMPELEWRYGYFAILLVMALVFAGMVVYFRRKKWF